MDRYARVYLTIYLIKVTFFCLSIQLGVKFIVRKERTSNNKKFFYRVSQEKDYVMKYKVNFGLLFAGAMIMCSTPPAVAQSNEGGAQTWSGSVTFRSPNERAVDLATAIAIKKARDDGLNENTYIEGDYNSYVNNEYQGPVSSSSSTNAINSTSNTTSIGDGAKATVINKTTATSGTANQDTASQTAVRGGDGSNSVTLSGFQ